jgi:hypothetical protein
MKKMVTKAELEKKVKDLENEIKGLNADRSIFHTELIKLAIKENYSVLLEFLNPFPKEIEDIKEILENE